MRSALLVLALAIGLVGGCSRVPSTIAWEPEDPSFTGVKGARQAATRLFWVHGMCNHDREWAVERARLLGEALGLTYSVDEAPRRPASDTRLELYEASFGDDDKLPATFVVWTPFTKATKAVLAADRSTSDPVMPGETPFRRARINEQVKTVIFNECLADAVIYAGRQGDPLRAAMPQALCDMLGGTPEANRCRLPDGEGEQGSLFLLSESLGSKILTDGLYNLWASTATGSTEREALARRLGRTETFFVLANQIPILNLAGAVRSGPDPFGPPRSRRS